MNNSTADEIAGWSDLASMVLLGFALMVGDLTPKRPVWGRSRMHVAAITTAMLLLIIWTGFRFVYEGLTVTAPREFLAGSVLYLARWFYLMLRLSWPAFREARMFRVALALREVHNLRMGPSRDGPRFSDNEEDQNGRSPNYGRDAITKESRPRSRGEWDVIVRKGVHKASDRSRPHWRGFIDPEPIWHPDVEAWEVTLLEEGMHKDKLDIFGTTDLLSREDAMEKAYSQFYKVVLTAVRSSRPSSSSSVLTRQGTSVMSSGIGITSTLQGSSVAQDVQRTEPVEFAAQEVQPSQQPPLTQIPQQPEQQRQEGQVDFEKFASRWTGLPPEFIANNAGATDTRRIGFIARRVAADALAYVKGSGKEFRTSLQVACINECLEDTYRAQFACLDTVVVDSP